MSQDTDNFFRFFKLAWCATFILGAGVLITLLVLFFMWISKSAEANESGVIIDEPMIITEVQGKRDTIVTGVYGDNAVNLYRTRGPRGGQTAGTVGDRVILINHFPARRLNSIQKEDILDPSPEGRNE